ncbi:hypothetical protein [Ewingella americana]|uniref:Uncharacterized protein n=1 Tax=Ewingella americana TaxID=41202 RepID=A0A502GDL0_9GAMM|nr:hypothetical protein [Ewingella americana]TPG60005.1 hypothetical protein EAH77_15675 [Ewingella americana]
MNAIIASIKSAIIAPVKYSFGDINTIARWQNYNRSSRYTGDLKDVADHFPDFRTTDVKYLFRYLDLPDSYMEKLENDALQGGLESWTKSLETAQEFAKLSAKANGESKGNRIILKVSVDELQVLLDLDSMHRDPDFKTAIKYYENQGKEFDPGLGFKSNQQEVIAKSTILARKHIIERLNS